MQLQFVIIFSSLSNKKKFVLLPLAQSINKKQKIKEYQSTKTKLKQF